MQTKDSTQVQVQYPLAAWGGFTINANDAPANVKDKSMYVARVRGGPSVPQIDTKIDSKLFTKYCQQYTWPCLIFGSGSNLKKKIDILTAMKQYCLAHPNLQNHDVHYSGPGVPSDDPNCAGALCAADEEMELYEILSVLIQNCPMLKGIYVHLDCPGAAGAFY